MFSIKVIQDKYFDMILNWRNSDFVRLNMKKNNKISKEDHLKWLDQINISNYFIFFQRKVPIGLGCLHDVNLRERSAFWGIYIGEPKVALPGAGALLNLSVLQIGFNLKNMDQMFSDVLSSNKGALGMQRTLLHSNGIFMKDFYRFSITKDEWSSIFLKNKKSINRIEIEIDNVS